jgi:hypothetical protein
MASFAYQYVNGAANSDYRATLRAAAAKPYGYYGWQPGLVPAKGAGWTVGATGGAWAFRRPAFDAVGGLLDTCILGSADWHMAFGLAGAGSGIEEKHRIRGQSRGALLSRVEDFARLWEPVADPAGQQF